MSTLDILGNTSEQADSIRLMLKVRGMKDGRFIDADPLIILKADNHQGSDRWDVFYSFSLAVGITSKNTMMAIVQAFCLLVFLGLTVWQLNHLTWSITDYRVRVSSNLEKGAHVEQSDK